jgi:hypothetical protein
MKRALCLLALVACEKSAPPKAPSPFAGLDLPVLTAQALPVGAGPVLIATKTGIVLEGAAIVSITNGDIDPADKEGGSLGMKISKLSVALGALRVPEPRPPLQLAFDRSLTYRMMMSVMYSAKQREAG